MTNTELYREELLEHYKYPQNRGTLAKPTISIHESNPLCGDEVDLQLSIENSKLADVAFGGDACAVSTISSSLLTEYVKGKTLDEVKSIKKDDLLKMLDLNLSTSRVKCATLILEALEHAIEKYENDKNK